MTEYLTVGKSLPRLDLREKVTGRAVYTADMKLPGMLYAKLLRSPLPHAKVVSIDASRAEALPGVVAVLTRNDLIGNQRIDPYYGPVYKDQAIVALDKVRYVGDIVAAVAAVDEQTALEALDLIEVEYEELPAVFDALEAMKPGAPIIHEQVKHSQFGFADLVDIDPVAGTNICSYFKLRKGDVERGFGEADYVFEDVFTSQDTQHCALEVHTSIAMVEAGKLTVWSSTQSPFLIRTTLADIFKIPASSVRVIVPYVGGGYGSKLYPKLEPVVSALAWKTGRPVKIALTREEVFATITRHSATIKIKTGVKKDGTITARECEVVLDTGAYAEIGPRVSKKSGFTAAGPYKIPNVKLDSYCVYTNKVPAGAFRGFGVPQSTWAYESQIDMIAERLGLDPLEIRLKNLYDEGSEFITGETLRNVEGLKECLRKAAAAVNWGEKKEASADPDKNHLARGKGLACLIKSTLTPSISSAIVKLNEDGSVSIFAATVEIGQGSDTALAQIASEELGVPIEQVRVARPDTDLAPYDLYTASSRSTFHMGRAVQMAARDVKEQLIEIVAGIIGASPDELEARNQRVYLKSDPSKGLSYQEAILKHFGMKGGSLIGKGLLKTSKKGKMGEPVTSVFWFVAAAAAEVEVDRETGEVKILKYVSATDVGKAINPLACVQQINGGAITGVGQTLMEKLVYENGQLINPNFIDYNLPRFLDVPEEMVSILVEIPHEDGPFGAKGVGETALIPVPPAVANAVADAVGVRIKDLPITPEKILAALGEKKREMEKAKALG